MKNLKLADGIFTRPTEFGDSLMLGNLIGDHDAVIICVNNGSGWNPVAMRLPHQVYAEWLEELVAKYHALDIAAFPIHTPPIELTGS